MGITQENRLVVDLPWVFRGTRPWQAHPWEKRHHGPKRILQQVGACVIETTALQFLPIRCAGKFKRTLSIRPKRNQQRAKGHLYHLTAAVDRIFPGFLEPKNLVFLFLRKVQANAAGEAVGYPVMGGKIIFNHHLFRSIAGQNNAGGGQGSLPQQRARWYHHHIPVTIHLNNVQFVMKIRENHLIILHNPMFS